MAFGYRIIQLSRPISSGGYLPVATGIVMSDRSVFDLLLPLLGGISMLPGMPDGMGVVAGAGTAGCGMAGSAGIAEGTCIGLAEAGAGLVE